MAGDAPVRTSALEEVIENWRPRRAIAAWTSCQKGQSAIKRSHEQRYDATGPSDVAFNSPAEQISGWLPSSMASSVEPEWLAAKM